MDLQEDLFGHYYYYYFFFFYSYYYHYYFHFYNIIFYCYYYYYYYYYYNYYYYHHQQTQVQSKCIGNRIEWNPIQSVIIQVINKLGQLQNGSPIC